MTQAAQPLDAPTGPGDAPRRGAAVVVEHVSKSFGELVPALTDVSLTIAPGELVLLTGASGSGKSTILNIIAGLDRPDTGSVLVDGVSVPGLGDPARYRREVLGFVFQLHHLLAGLTAEENVEVPLIPCGMGRAERLALARAALDDVGLADRRTHRPAQLSGGERQCVAIARAIVSRPRLLLADEPTGALDSVSGEQTLDLLDVLRRAQGMTVLLVSHDPGAARHADRVLHLRDGRIVAQETGGAAAVSPAPPPGAAG